MSCDESSTYVESISHRARELKEQVDKLIQQGTSACKTTAVIPPSSDVKRPQAVHRENDLPIPFKNNSPPSTMTRHRTWIHFILQRMPLLGTWIILFVFFLAFPVSWMRDKTTGRRRIIRILLTSIGLATIFCVLLPYLKKKLI